MKKLPIKYKQNKTIQCRQEVDNHFGLKMLYFPECRSTKKIETWLMKLKKHVVFFFKIDGTHLYFLQPNKNERQLLLTEIPTVKI